MLAVDQFNETAEVVARENNLTRDVAEEYVSLIGDTPELDEAGLVIVRNADGAELARVRVPAED